MNVDPDTQMFLSGEDSMPHEGALDLNINKSNKNTEIIQSNSVS